LLSQTKSNVFIGSFIFRKRFLQSRNFRNAFQRQTNDGTDCIELIILLHKTFFCLFVLCWLENLVYSVAFGLLLNNPTEKSTLSCAGKLGLLSSLFLCEIDNSSIINKFAMGKSIKWNIKQ